jgi:hypothetical protein
VRVRDACVLGRTKRKERTNPEGFILAGAYGPLHAGEIERAKEWGAQLVRASVGTEDVAIPAAATQSWVRRWGGRIAGVAVALAFVVVPLPSSGWLLWNVGRVLHVDVMPLHVYWEDVQPGMCVRDDDPNGLDFLVVDCNAEHQEEVMSRSTLARSGGWPGDAAVEDMAGEKCKLAFATYVGLELGQSRLDFDFVTPDESGWNDLRPMPILRWPMIGRATLICLVLDPDHDQITRALRGAHE